MYLVSTAEGERSESSSGGKKGVVGLFGESREEERTGGRGGVRGVVWASFGVSGKGGGGHDNS